jgi:hypothetical protein
VGIHSWLENQKPALTAQRPPFITSIGAIVLWATFSLLGADE